MSNAISRFEDPGLPEHQHRKSDIDAIAANRAERQVAVLFLLSSVGTIGTIASYIFIDSKKFIYLPVLGDTNAQQLALGTGLAASLFFIGIAAVHWAKTLMPDEEVIAERHEFRSSDEDRSDFVSTVKERSGMGHYSP